MSMESHLFKSNLKYFQSCIILIYVVYKEFIRPKILLILLWKISNFHYLDGSKNMDSLNLNKLIK